MNKKTLYLLLPLLLAYACTKEPSSSLAVTFVTDIENAAPEMKAVIEGDNFAQANTFGLFVYHAESPNPMTVFQDYGSKYANIMAKKDGQNWKYTLNGLTSASASENFFLIEPSAGGSGALAICAYAPFVDGAKSIKEIPFTIGGQHSKITDLMWAVQNQNSSNLNIKPTGKKDETVPLTFRHALSMIRIKLKCKHAGTTMQVSSIKIRKNSGGDTPLYGSGTFNAVTGQFNGDLIETSEVVFDCKNERMTFNSETSPGIPILIIPAEYKADGDYEIVFEFNGQTLPTIYPIKQNDIKVENVCKFEQGKVYNFEFVFNNYAQITGVTINTDDDWTSTSTDMEF